MTDKNETNQFTEEENTSADEEIIDLTNAAPEPVAADDDIVELTAAVEVTPEADDDIVELMEAVEEPPPVDEPVEVSAEAPEEEEISILTDDDDIDGFDDDLPDGLDLPPDDDDDFVESMGMEVESMEDELDEDTSPDFPEDLPEEPSGAEPLSVTTEQVEAALENVVKEMFGEKMERILIDVVKKTISQEIDRLKEALLEDLKGDE